MRRAATASTRLIVLAVAAATGLVPDAVAQRGPAGPPVPRVELGNQAVRAASAGFCWRGACAEAAPDVRSEKTLRVRAGAVVTVRLRTAADELRARTGVAGRSWTARRIAQDGSVWRVRAPQRLPRRGSLTLDVRYAGSDSAGFVVTFTR